MFHRLFQLNHAPDFDAFHIDDIKPAVQNAIKEARKTIAHIKTQPETTWLNTVEPLTDLTERVGRIWGVVSHLNAVVDTPKLRAIYNELMPEVTLFFTEIGQDLALFERLNAIKNSPEFQQLTRAQQVKLEHDLRDFVLSGALLPEKEQTTFAALQAESAQLAAQFSQNVLDATDAFSLYFEDASQLSGLPDDALAMFQAAAQNDNKTGYKIGLQMPHYLAIMQYADNRALREKLYYAYVTRASELGEAKWDNTANITRRLALAQEEAQLLGYDNAAELSLVTKMADTPKQVIEFINHLAEKAKPFAQKDFEEVAAFAKETLNLPEIAAWDLSYASEKLRQAKYAFSETEVKKYFPASKVISGLFEQIKQLYNIDFIEKTVPTWHPDVRYFELMSEGKTIGGVYMDLYAREGKRSGAWMNDYRGRRRFLSGEFSGSLQTPVAYLVCNFTPPINAQESRLTHDEILTLFHEMGHGLHHLLTQVDELGVSGINGVEWDAVELPSQFMENFAWEYAVLAKMSEHEDSKATLPESLYQKMLAAKNFQRGLFLIRQMEFALFDILIYQNRDSMNNWFGTLQAVRQKIAIIQPPAYNRFANSFSHIFAGGYAAGYYSYAWAEVLSADAYAAFEESDDIAATGKRFWQEILAQGGSRSAAENFQAFRQRPPSIDALFKHSGFIQ